MRDCAMASKQSEQDTLRVTQLEFGDILFIYVRTYVCHVIL